MYELTLGNWTPCTRLLMESVNEWYGGLILIYRFVVGFAMVKVITGVFLRETFRVAGMNDELMIVEKARASTKQQQKMQTFLSKIDSSDDGLVQRDEFMTAL